ncbi:hypothetical protein GALL_284960 [mine drainage metagenome]|uniref:Uncharacterized protein n=1 Tax=mine drainage metagenome TaxID=410659 RepID=A0A1J5R0W9_9ZZZZ
MSSTDSNIAILDRALAVSALLVEVQYAFRAQTAITRLHDERLKALAFEEALYRISERLNPMSRWATLTPEQKEDFEAGLAVHAQVLSGAGVYASGGSDMEDDMEDEMEEE